MINSENIRWYTEVKSIRTSLSFYVRLSSVEANKTISRNKNNDHITIEVQSEGKEGRGEHIVFNDINDFFYL
jgi:hypothetical protein